MKSPFLIVFSLGKRHEVYGKNIPKICIIGENLPSYPVDEGTLIIHTNLGFTRKLLANPTIYYPFGAFKYDFSKLNAEWKKARESSPFAKRSKFCCIIISNGNSSFRNSFFQKLSKVEHVDSAGKALNNTGFVIQGSWESNELIDFMKGYKFCICFENSIALGYLTEKIVNAFRAGCIPSK